jgi:tetratricopeptide (TPR) repeat protein
VIILSEQVDNVLTRDRYHHIFFIDASTTATTRGDLESAIRSIDGHEQDTYESALLFMSKHSKEWLYILDNADDPDLDLTPYLPSCSHGTIIITSRNRRTGFLSTTHHLELGPMREQEAISTLCHAARKATPLNEAEFLHATHLVRTLGYLALAIVQAGVYVYEMTSGPSGGFGFAQYSALHEQHRSRLLRQKSHPSLDRYPYGVYAALDISYTRLPESCREFLHLCSFLRHTNVPVSIFSSAASNNFKDNRKLIPRSREYQHVQLRLRKIFCRNGQWDELQLHELIQTLSSFSLLSISFVHNLLLLRLHPLVHSHAHDKLTPDELPMYRQMSITCISTRYKSLPLNARQFVFPHCIKIYEEDGGDSMHINDMMQFGQLMWDQGSYQQAEKVFRKIADIVVMTHGHDSQDTISVLSWLASTLGNLGKRNEAQALEREVLTKCQKILGLEHPDTIRASANLASTLRSQGRWDEAEALQREVLTKLQKVLGLEHPDTIQASANLGSTLRSQGKWNEAEVGQREVLTKLQKTPGPEHPDTIRASANLASTLWSRGKWNEAEALQREVLAMRQKILGIEHPDSILALHNLAATLHKRGRTEEAIPLSLQATQLAEKVIGQHHPNMVIYLKHLKIYYESTGKSEEASAVQEKLRLVDHRR